MKNSSFFRLIATLIIAMSLAACAATRVEPSTGEYLDDSVLTTKVKAALLKDPTVSGTAVNVETFKGTVQLSGFVKSSNERDTAVKVARDVAGVKSVKNDILIR